MTRKQVCIAVFVLAGCMGAVGAALGLSKAVTLLLIAVVALTLLTLDSLRRQKEERLMPEGPRGEKRPADGIGLAVMVGRIATGEVEDELDPVKTAVAVRGSKGGKARAENMTPERRREIAQAAARKRWGD